MSQRALNYPRLKSLALLVGLSLGSTSILIGCGGGRGGSASTTPATTSSNVATYTGPVSGLGSIVVNGVRFETIGASVHDGDDPYGSHDYTSAIGLGTVVSVTGSADDANGTGSASQIRIVGGLRGTVISVDQGAGTLNLAGQTVRVGATTVFAGTLTSLAALAGGSFVEVYGLLQADGSFAATRIEGYATQPAGIAGVAVRGIVTTAAGGMLTLSNGLQVSYAADTVSPAGSPIAAGSDVRVLASAAPVNGQLVASRVIVLGAATLASGSATPTAGAVVKIKGVVDSITGSTLSVSGTSVDIGTLPAPTLGAVVEVKGTISGTTLVASRIELEGSGRSVQVLGASGQPAYTSNYKQELYGVVADFVSLSRFTVQGVPVDASQARFEYGAAGLANNSYVEVKGMLQNGVLVATKVELKGVTASLSSGSGSGTSLSSGNRSFEVYGTLSCLTYPADCTLNASPALPANLSAARWEKGSYTSGIYVEAKGYLDSNGVFQVSKVERKR